jgi:hypothetical protein
VVSGLCLSAFQYQTVDGEISTGNSDLNGEAREPTPPSMDQKLLTIEESVREMSIALIPTGGTLLSEDGGLWLTDPRLAGKRLDVCVDARNRPRSTGRQLSACDTKVGYIEVLQPFTDKTLGKTIPVRMGEFATVVKLEPKWLRPCRTTLFHPGLDGERCLSQTPIPIRVVVLGPDANGDTSRVGQYAEIIPPGGSDKVVVVRFPRLTFGQRSELATYHVDSLCRSANSQGVRSSVTRF